MNLLLQASKPALVRKKTSVASGKPLVLVTPLYVSSSIVSGVPTLSRKSTTILSGDDASGLKRRSSSRTSDVGLMRTRSSPQSSPELKRKQTEETSAEKVVELRRKATSERSTRGMDETKNKSPSIISLSEARAMLREQRSSVRIVNSASVKRKATLTKVGSKSHQVAKPASLATKQSSVKRVSGYSKRKLFPKRPFEFAEESPKKRMKRSPQAPKSKEEDSSDERALLYLSGEYLALKSDDGKLTDLTSF